VTEAGHSNSTTEHAYPTNDLGQSEPDPVSTNSLRLYPFTSITRLIVPHLPRQQTLLWGGGGKMSICDCPRTMTVVSLDIL